MSAKHNHEQHQEKQPIMSHDKMNHMNHDMAHEQMAMSHQHEGMKGMDHSCIWGILNKILAVIDFSYSDYCSFTNDGFSITFSIYFSRF